ncbi:hypothetical protein N7454_008689 [Penicillium verhagenii]|nr:hypothetical protein N7454_008689 [Penicillium verhagenii]
MLPLVGDLAPPARRATALSIVSSGLVLGLLFARLLAGIIAAYSSWRNIYWLSLALQYAIFVLLWAFMPDYPRTNTDISYFKVLTSIVQLFITSPVLVYATFMGFFLSATFTSFWTTPHLPLIRRTVPLQHRHDRTFLASGPNTILLGSVLLSIRYR